MKKTTALMMATVLGISVLGSTMTAMAEDFPMDTSDWTDDEKAMFSDLTVYEEQPTVVVIPKALQYAFWQSVDKGAQEVADAFNVNLVFDAPADESAVATQVDMANSYLNQDPAVIAVCPIDDGSFVDFFNSAMEKEMPLIGFNNSINAPEGAILATAATDNYLAAKEAATQLFTSEKFMANLEAATAEAPVLIGCMPQDVTSPSMTQRAQGFIDGIKEGCAELFPDGVAVTGQENFAEECAGDMCVEIRVQLPATSSTSDAQLQAQTYLNEENLIGLFYTDTGRCDGLLAATSDGMDLAEGGRYENVTVVGFDAGANQKAAIKSGYIYGAVAQDPVRIGQDTMLLAIAADQGKEVKDIGTKYVFYQAEDIDDPAMADILYD